MNSHYNIVSTLLKKGFRKRHHSVYLQTGILVFVFYSLCLSQITAAVAANMQYAMDEICILFTKKHKIKVTPVYGGSGNLVAQIRNGAPFDIFISADMSRPESLFTGGYAIEKPETYAFGKLILWTTKELDFSKGISITTDVSVKSLALGDMTSTVYGPAAKQVLERSGLWDRVKSACIFGSTISQVAHYIVSGSVDLGIAAKSTVLADNMVKKGHWIDIDTSLYDPIPQGIAILSHGLQNHFPETKLLYDFLFSSDAQIILTKYGYGLP